MSCRRWGCREGGGKWFKDRKPGKWASHVNDDPLFSGPLHPWKWSESISHSVLPDSWDPPISTWSGGSDQDGRLSLNTSYPETALCFPRTVAVEGGAAPTMPLFSFATHSGHRRSLYILGGGGRSLACMYLWPSFGRQFIAWSLRAGSRPIAYLWSRE